MRRILLILASLLLIVPALASDKTLTPDTIHSRIGFTAKTLFKVEGSFGKYTADINQRTCSAHGTCPAGTFLETPGTARNCAPQGSCGPGSVQTAAGTSVSPTLCAACVPGSYCAGGTVPPAECVLGTWNDDGDPATPCVAKNACATGQYVVREGTSMSNRVCEGA